MNAYESTLEQLPEVFTSHHYLDMLRKSGLPINVIEQGHHLDFLAERCKRLTPKTWRKRVTTENVKSAEVIVTEVTAPKISKIEEAISLLKSNGYKIYKTELVEV
jgi:biotin operon repressor